MAGISKARANPAVEPQTTEPREGFQGGGRTEMTPEEYNRALEAAKDVLRQQLRKQIDAANGGFDPAVPIDWQLSRPKITDRVPPQRVVARRVAPLGAPVEVGPGRVGSAAPAAAAIRAYAPVAPAAEAPAAPVAARQQGPVERAMAVVRSVPQAAYETVSSPVATAQNIAREIFSGNNYQSTGEPVMSDGRLNWGDPESAADFFRADAALQEMRPYREEGFADGGHVEHALRLIQDEYPTQYLPNVGRQVMADGGDTMAGFMPPTPDETPDDRGERWQAALRNYRNFPVRPGEATLQPADITARDYIAQAIAGEGGPSYGSELRKRAANLLVGSRGLPDTGIGFGLADAPMVTGIPLQALDIADATRRGNYGEAALGAALPVAFWARKPIISAGRRAVEVAGDVLGRVPAPVAAGAAAAAAMTPSEAEAGPVGTIVRAAKKAVSAAPERPPLFDYSRLGDVPHVSQFDLPRNVPPRGVPARVMDLTNNPTVREEMLKTIEQGEKMGGSRWYNADPLRDKFVEQFGAERGGEAFRKYMDFVAATSPRSEVGANVRNASYYYNRAMSGQGMPPVGERNPAPYGHLAQRLHQMNAERVVGAGWDPLNNPKPASFVENLVGNQQPVTVDTHAFRLPAIIGRDPRFLETAFQVSKDAPKQNIARMIESGDISMNDAAARAAYWQAQPKANKYAAMEQYYKSLGRDLGLTPAQTQAAAWVGGGARTGLKSDESKPFLKFVEDRIYKTAIEKNMDPQDVMRLFVRGEMPLYANGGSVSHRAMMIAKELGSSPRETVTS